MLTVWEHQSQNSDHRAAGCHAVWPQKSFLNAVIGKDYKVQKTLNDTSKD